MKIAICSDHRGYNLKNDLVKKMKENNISFEDYGCFSEERCDYPNYAFKVGEAVKNNECEFGIVICGSGDGVCSLNDLYPAEGYLCICNRIS